MIVKESVFLKPPEPLVFAQKCVIFIVKVNEDISYGVK